MLCFSWNLDIFWKTICSVSKIVEVLFIIRDHWTSRPILDAFSVVADDRRCWGLASPRRRSSRASKGWSWVAALRARARSSAGGRSLPQATQARRPLETPGSHCLEHLPVFLLVVFWQMNGWSASNGSATHHNYWNINKRWARCVHGQGWGHHIFRNYQLYHISDVNFCMYFVFLTLLVCRVAQLTAGPQKQIFSKFYPRDSYVVFFCDICDKNAVNQGIWSKTTV